jgi:hypothetical protein
MWPRQRDRLRVIEDWNEHHPELKLTMPTKEEAAASGSGSDIQELYAQ